jgi:hypothetical protein
MSSGLYIHGFVPPDETWLKMKAIWDSCNAAKVPIPDAVYDFFDGVTPEDTGMQVKVPIREYNSQCFSGYEVVLAELPPNVKILRFVRD